jgi:hypothetical protein
MSEPICICPSAILLAPNQTTPELAQLMTSITTGNINAINRPVMSEVPVSLALTTSKRCTSWRSRTKARTTRRPEICSRSTRLTLSRRSCMSRYCGIIRPMMIPREIASAVMLTPSSHDRPAS